jgi:hypothetical protein
MKHIPRIMLGLLIFCGISGELKAGLNDVAITATRKKLDEDKSRVGQSVTVKTKQVAYSISVQNKTFQDLKDITVKYMLFYDNAKPGEAERAQETSVRGSDAVPVLGRGETKIVETKPVVLTSAALDGGWHYTNGAKQKAEDRIAGVWIRAYVNNEIVGEYANPTSMTSRVWKD